MPPARVETKGGSGVRQALSLPSSSAPKLGSATLGVLVLATASCSQPEIEGTKFFDAAACFEAHAAFEAPAGDIIVLSEEPKPCRTTQEAHRYYQQCEIAKTLNRDWSCEDIFNPDANRIPSTLSDAADTREALEHAYRRDCGRDPIPTATLLEAMQRCYP